MPTIVRNKKITKLGAWPKRHGMLKSPQSVVAGVAPDLLHSLCLSILGHLSQNLCPIKTRFSYPIVLIPLFFSIGDHVKKKEKLRI